MDVGNYETAWKASVVPHLTALTHLELAHARAFEPLAAHISSMVKLQELSITYTGLLGDEVLAGMHHLTALTNLTFKHCGFTPAVLLQPLGATQLLKNLQTLTLYEVSVVPDSDDDGEQLLLLLCQLTSLRVLRMERLYGSCEWPDELQHYSALTASSKLRELYCDAWIPSEAWTHVFSARRPLSHLHTFDMMFDCDEFNCDEHENGSTLMSTAGVASLVACCPALQHVMITVQQDASLAALCSLTALTKLKVVNTEPHAIEACFSRLTQLQDLYFSLETAATEEARAELGRQDLVPLAALRRLSRLEVWCEECVREGEDDLDLTLINQAPEGSPPDVWLQLLQECAADKGAQPAVISTMLQQLQQQEQQASQQAAQLEQHRQEAAAIRAEAAAEAAAARTEAAELRGRVQALEGQLQVVLAALQQQQQQQQQAHA